MKLPVSCLAIAVAAFGVACNLDDENSGVQPEANNSNNTNNANNTGTNNTSTNNANNTGTNNTSTNNTNNINNTNNQDEIWTPGPGTTWQWQINGEAIDTTVNVDMYDVDLFDTPRTTIDMLKSDGRIVVCYFSAGTLEDWRPDASEFEAIDYANELPDWPGEFYLDIRSPNVRSIMEGRLDLAATKGCDGVEPDNVDIYNDESGFELTSANQIDYNSFLATQAHERGLSIGLKNALELINRLEPEFDWAINEECFDYDECSDLQPFLNAGKAVFHVEYVDERSMGEDKVNEVCGNVPAGFSTLIKTWDLDEWYLSCE